MDVTIERFFVWWHHPWLTRMAEAVTTLGSELVLGVAVLVLLVVLAARRRWRDAVMTAVVMGGAGILTLGLKPLVARPRPDAGFRPPGEPAESSFSFPSGHTLHVTAFVVLLLALAWPLLRSSRARRVAVIAAGCVALAVGLFRVYLGYHWATDVLGGWVLGAGWSALVVGWFAVRGPAEPVSAERQVASTGSES